MIVNKHGRDVTLEFPESVCVEKENTRRVEEGRWISSGYFCFQLHEQINLYRDIFGYPTQVTVKRKAGCELRKKEPGARHNLKFVKL